MRYWFDTEFDERDQVIHLISIGILSADGREYYAVNADYDEQKANPWLQENVLPYIAQHPRTPREKMRKEILEFFTPAPSEIWAYYGEYDWVVLRQLIGHMIEWPEGWPLSHMSLTQLHQSLGNPDLPKQDNNTLHHALADARWCRDAWQFLTHPSA